MLTFSVNKDISEAVMKVHNKMSKVPSDLEREHLGSLFLSIVEAEYKAENKDYKDAISYAITVNRNQKLKMLSSKEISIVHGGELTNGYKGALDRRLAQDLVVDETYSEQDEYANTSTVDLRLMKSFYVYQWYDVCELTLYDFGVNLTKCLEICLNKMLVPVVPIKIKLAHLGYTLTSAPTWLKDELTKKDSELSVVELLRSIVTFYRIEDLLEAIMKDSELKTRCMDEEACFQYNQDLDIFVKPDYLALMCN